VLRLIHIAIMGNRYYFGDTAEYQAAALRMLHGLGLSGTAPRAPLYPMFMAVSFRLGGEGNYVFARLLNFGLALALIAVVSRLAARLGGPAAGMLAAIMMAVAPTMVFTAGLLYPTTLYMLLLTSLTLVAWDLGEQPRLGSGLAFGALFALGWLTDQVFIAPSAAIGLWLLWRLRRHRMRLARALAAAVIMAAILAYPYALALERQTSDGVFMRKAQSVLFSARTDPVLSHERWISYPPGTTFEALRPHEFLLREGNLFANHPIAYLHDWTWEFIHFFRPVPDRVQTENRYTQPLVLYVGGLYFLILLTLAILGLGFGRGPRRGRILLAFVVLGTAAFYSFFFTQARYRVPIECHLIVLAALGVRHAFPRVAQVLELEDTGGRA
jgi:4-amino-4-deoxy-L-arabinose transferase-like glycosyltransferase